MNGAREKTDAIRNADDIVKLIDQFAFSRSIEDLPAMRKNIVARIPDAATMCKKVANPDVIDAIFDDLRHKLDEGLQQDRHTRSMVFASR